MATKVQGGSNTAGLTNVTDNYELAVKPSNPVNPDGSGDAENVGSVRFHSEVDTGIYTGTPDLISPETDDDYRLRVSHDVLLDYEKFNYGLQNTSKWGLVSSTLAATLSAAVGITTNSNGVNTATTGIAIYSFNMFPIYTNATTAVEMSMSFTELPTANTTVDFGLFFRGAANSYAPSDGVYFRVKSDGLFGVVNNNTSEILTPVFPASNGTGTFTYTTNKVYKFLIQVNGIKTTFWIDNEKVGTIINQNEDSLPCQSSSLPFGLRHAIVGGAAGTANFKVILNDYKVTLRGPLYTDTLANVNNRMLGTFQGISGNTMGSIGTYTNSTNPTAAVPTNATLSLGATGLLNQAWETFSYAVNTDVQLLQHQVPLGTNSLPGKRLRITGVKLSSFVQTVLAGGPQNRVFTLAFGGSAATLAGSESSSMTANTVKNRRIVLLPELTQTITAAQAVNTPISQPGGYVCNFTTPIYVNPGEYVSVNVKGIGTVGTSGTIATYIQLDYSWE